MGSSSIRLLITDPLHPVVEPTITSLKRRLPGCSVTGVVPNPPSWCPPSLDGVLSCPPIASAEFAPVLLDVVGRHGIDALLPWTDADTLAIAPLAASLERAGVALVCPPIELAMLACDKLATVERLAAVGVPVPETVLVRTGDELRDAAGQLGYPRRRLLLKPRGLAGGHGVWSIRADAELTVSTPRPQLPLEAMVAALRTQQAADWLLQLELAGTDVSVDVLADDGRVLASVARTRDATLGGLCVQGRVLPPPTPLDGLVAGLIARLGWSSLANVQLVVDEDGRPFVYEINARAAGSIGIGAYAGVDMLDAALVYHLSGRVPSRPQAVERAVAFRRSWQDHWWPIDEPAQAPGLSNALSNANATQDGHDAATTAAAVEA